MGLSFKSIVCCLLVCSMSGLFCSISEVFGSMPFRVLPDRRSSKVLASIAPKDVSVPVAQKKEDVTNGKRLSVVNDSSALPSSKKSNLDLATSSIQVSKVAIPRAKLSDALVFASEQPKQESRVKKRIMSGLSAAEPDMSFMQKKISNARAFSTVSDDTGSQDISPSSMSGSPLKIGGGLIHGRSGDALVFDEDIAVQQEQMPMIGNSDKKNGASQDLSKQKQQASQVVDQCPKSPCDIEFWDKAANFSDEQNRQLLNGEPSPQLPSFVLTHRTFPKSQKKKTVHWQKSDEVVQIERIGNKVAPYPYGRHSREIQLGPIDQKLGVRQFGVDGSEQNSELQHYLGDNLSWWQTDNYALTQKVNQELAKENETEALGRVHKAA